MAPDTDSNTGDFSDRMALDQVGVERRPLLKALGIGATLSLGSGVAAGQQDDDQIDPLYGYSAPTAEDIPDHLQPDHEVQLMVQPPNPDAGTPPYFFFEPAGLQVNPGDLVQFTFSTPDHTVTAYHPAHGFQRRIPEDVPPFSSPAVGGGGAWLYRFDQPGVYDYYCGPHHAFGMAARLVVSDLDEDGLPDYVGTFEGSEDPPILAPYSREMLEGELNAFSETNENVEWVWLTPQEVLATDVLDPMQIQEVGTVPFEAVLQALGRGGAQTTTTM